MTLLTQILLVAAFVLFLIDAFWQPATPRFRLLSAGLMCMALAILLIFLGKAG